MSSYTPSATKKSHRNVEILILFIILGIATFLRFFRLNELMMFIGDFGWFYVSARDLLITHSVPLVGITASHVWLHQGPLWTYLLAFTLLISHFNPLSGGYFSAVIGVVTVAVIYYVGLQMFSRNVAVIASLLYATSPLVIIHSRMAYHTNPIPLFSLLLIYCMWNWIILQKVMYFPFTILQLTILYNFELATQVLWVPVVGYLLYGILKNKSYTILVLNQKMITYSVIALLFPMIPILIYDFSHDFSQTIKYGVWILYHLVTVLGFPTIHESQTSPVTVLGTYLLIFMQRLLYLPNSIIAVCLFIASFTVFLYYIYYKQKSQEILLLIFVATSLGGIIAVKTTSEAYLPMCFPFIFLLLGVAINKLFSSRLLITGVIVLLLSCINIYSLLSQNYLMGANKPYGLSFTTRKEAAAAIISLSQGKQYNLVGKGEGSQFESYTKSYEYLTWWMGNGPSRTKQKTIITVNETSGGVNLTVINHK